jgi:hypothetical protein
MDGDKNFNERKKNSTHELKINAQWIGPSGGLKDCELLLKERF